MEMENELRDSGRGRSEEEEDGGKEITMGYPASKSCHFVRPAEQHAIFPRVNFHHQRRHRLPGNRRTKGASSGCLAPPW
ncbi:hypothetical protein Pcinc_041891 [Petrolisthes cinctipes]|uniref:Uncharacterized protein n=1 Tax=Petrolisthes cinctipes TaxID=88211 RepID=A0AAE1EJC6_PETCI|nr:hypothetical protein Pcinc_041891 [Petrolisthes cinctipes]